MVLMRGTSIIRSSQFVVLAMCLHGTAIAQEYGSTGSRVQSEDDSYQLEPIDAGPLTFTVGAELHTEYTDNVFAEPTNAQDDFVISIRPHASIVHNDGPYTTRLDGSAKLRRFADFGSEDSEDANITLSTAWSPQRGEAVTITGSWDRATEDRGDPEARRILGIGPRVFENVGGTVGYRRAGSRILLDLSAGYRQIDAVARIDDDRDHDNYTARATVGFRTGGAIYLTATGYYSRLDFRFDQPVFGGDRDAKTLGGLIGVEFADGGLIEGRVGVGIFDLDTDSAAREDRTGFSLQGQLTYRPRERTSIRLDLFNGDVASFRGGGSNRIDTRIGLSLQQEARHNLYASVGVEWERTSFFTIDESQETWRLRGEAEYLLNRQMSAFVNVSYDDRTSDRPFDEFGRFRTGAGLRFRF